MIILSLNLFLFSLLGASMYSRKLSFAFPTVGSKIRCCRISSVVAASHRDTVLSLVQDELRTSLQSAFGEDVKDIDPLVSSAKSSHGDYQSNVAMVLSKQLKMKPVAIAEKVIGALPFGAVLDRADVSGPGFINLHISNSLIQHRLLRNLQDGSRRFGIQRSPTPVRVVVDFSSPNIAKEMHVGHLRSTIIGDCLSKVLEFLGHDVLRLNHVGDWGTQFGMLIRHLKDTNPDSLATIGELDVKEAAAMLNIGDLVEFYKSAKKRFDDDQSFQNACRQEVVHLQSGKEDSLKLWNVICEKSRQEFQSIYDILGVNLIERGESFYNPMLASIVEELQARGILVDSEGAKCIFLPGYKGMDGKPLPLIVQKSDGGYLYATTDLAAVKQRVGTEKAKRIIYVTDAGQSQHFSMVFDAAKAAHFIPEDGSIELSHVPFGLVLGEDGKKIKTRAGESVKLRELLDEAVNLAEEGFIARHKADGNVEELSESTRNELRRKAITMGIGAVKYADLAMNRESNYKFSFSKMLSMHGNTAPYMMYAFVRIQGIKRKAAEAIVGVATDKTEEIDRKLLEVFQSMKSSELVFTEQEELMLCKHLLRFDETLLDVADKLFPNKLADYIFDLSQRFNQFYEKCPVIKADTQTQKLSRLALCHATSDVLKISLDLLGIDTLEKI